MLRYLVTSKVRRRLLMLLWGEARRGSAADLADLANSPFGATHAELKAMLHVGLAVVTHEDGKDVYSANLRHPESDALRALARAEEPELSNSDDDEVRRGLVTLGAPLRGVSPAPVSSAQQLEMLVRGARLARTDAVVARSLPLCFWKLRTALDMDVLAELAVRAEDKHLVGFFVELAGELGGDRRLGGLAQQLRDGRMKAVRDFFVGTKSKELARDFPLATKWGFRMNMDFESFRSLFRKFVDD